jgi:hypothetical protein
VRRVLAETLTPSQHVLGIHDFFVFLATGIVLNLTPGQDTF